MMTLSDRFYLYGLLTLVLLTSLLLLFKPLILVFILMGSIVSFAGYWLLKHPAWGQLAARVLAECLGLLLMLAIFVSLMMLYGQLLGV